MDPVSASSPASRTVVLGFDGASDALLRKWTAAGHLPQFSRMMREGSWGCLESVIPYQSIAAWTSFMTGRNPARHGHTGWVTRRPGTRTVLRVNNAATIDGKTLWEMLGENGKRIGVLSVPVTYPVRPVNGFMTSDWMTPSTAKTTTHPPELSAELKARFGDDLFEYRSAPFELGRVGEEEFFRNLYRVTEARTVSAFHLMETRPWDFFMMVFTGTDTIQHFFWHDTDPAHPWHDPSSPRGDSILKYYQAMDGILGRFRERLAPGTRLVVVSDHGLGPLYKRVNLNNLLIEQGFLVLKTDRPRDSWGWVDFLERIDVFGIRQRLPRWLRRRVFNLIMEPPVDWGRTKAFSGSADEGGVFINVEGRNLQGSLPRSDYERVRDEVKRLLEELTDPETGRKVVTRVHRKEELYRGPYLEGIPDLLLVLAAGFELVDSYDRDRLFLPPDKRHSGTHLPDGVILAVGDGIAAGREITGASIMDACPTLLHLMDVPVPEDLDGKVLDLFTPEHRAARPVAYAGASAPAAAPAAGENPWAEGGEEEIKEKLKELGYLD